MMKNPCLLLALCVGLASGVTTHATTYPKGDLLIGFSQQSGNDVVYDLGAASALTDGKIWTLGTLLTTNFTLSTVNWGVIGDTTNPTNIWTTTDGMQAGTIGSKTDLNRVNAAAGTLYQFFPGTGAGQSVLLDSLQDYSWAGQTINGALPSDYYNAYENPNVVGLTNASLWLQTAIGSSPVKIGKFTLSANGTVTYNVVSAGQPPVPQVSLTRTNATAYISFTTASPFTYTLYYTNSAGLSAPVSTWPHSATTVTGDGARHTLTDTSADAVRFYRIGAQ